MSPRRLKTVLRELRESKEMTQMDLAKKSGEENTQSRFRVAWRAFPLDHASRTRVVVSVDHDALRSVILLRTQDMRACSSNASDRHRQSDNRSAWPLRRISIRG